MAEEVKEQATVSSRQRLTDRYRNSRPDLKWDEEGVDNDIDALAADELEGYDKERASRAEMDGKLNKLFKSNPSASKIFIGWANGQDPVENLIEIYGDDFVEALQSQEGKEKFKSALDKWRKGKEADAEHQRNYDANIEASARTIVEYADKNGLSDEQITSLVEKAHQLGSDILEGRYTTEILDMVNKGGNYDKAVEDAMEEGRVRGKGETIRRELRQSKPATGLPPTVGAQNNVGMEATPTKSKKGSIGMFGGIPVNKN